MDSTKIIPLEVFFNRIFPLSYSNNKPKSIVDNQIFKPRKDLEEIYLKFPIDWESIDKKSDRNYRMQLQGWTMFHPIMNFFDEYSDKEKIIDYFFNLLSDWYTIYGDDVNSIVTSRMPNSYAWYGMSVGFRALVLAFFINRINYFSIDISVSRKEFLKKISLKHINHLKNEQVFLLNNHGLFQIHGLMALIQLYGIKNYQKTKEYALNKIELLVLSQYDNNGIHLEHSPLYHFYVLKILKILSLVDWYSEKYSIWEIVKKAKIVERWLVYPDKRIISIGDSSMNSQKSIDFTSQDTIDELEIVSYDKKIIYSNFNDSGYSIFRTYWNEKIQNSTYFFFMGMYKSKTHKHRDCLSFEWFDRGCKILCDSGQYGYVSDKYRNYVLSNRAHNTVEIERFDILKMKPYGSSIKNSSYKQGVFKLNAKLDYSAIVFDRKIYLKPSRWMIVSDRLTFQKARELTQWFHLEKNYSLVSLDGSLVTFKAGDRELIIHCLNNNLETKIYYGDTKTMQGFISEKDYLLENNYALGFSFFAKEEKVVTILALDSESYIDALKYIEFNGIFLNKNKILLKSNNIIPNIKHSIVNNSKTLEFIKGKQSYSVIENGIVFDFFLDYKANKKMVIMLPGAINRDRGIYNFQRFSWSDDVDYSLLTLLDPTIQDSNNLGIGWFQGTKENYALPKLINLLKNILKINKILEKEVSFFGSSAGGFSVLNLANSFLNSKIIVINPQIYIYKYSKDEYEKLISYSYEELSKDEIINNYKDRLIVDVDFTIRKEMIYYYQNIRDIHHVEKHRNPYLETLNRELFQLLDVNDKVIPDKKLYIFNYNDPESGHSPPNKEKTLAIIENIIHNKIVSGYIWKY